MNKTWTWTFAAWLGSACAGFAQTGEVAGSASEMLTLAELGAMILPPVLSFYSRPATVEEHIHHIIGKILCAFDLELPGFRRWM